jgi:hypothetical protein
MATERGKKPGEDKLSDAAQKWLAALPDEIKPKNLAEQYPRICNHFARVWRQHEEVDSYFNELVQDSRGDRKGFAFSVMTDISTLRDYYDTKVHPDESPFRVTWDPRHRV